MKHFIIILFLIVYCTLSTVNSFSQPYGNEWIDFTAPQKYLKFKIVEDGIYRIDYNTLNNALSEVGEQIDSINPKRYQIFGRGDELYIHIEGESDGIFNSTDFIEFYARKNDGWLDSLIYKNSLSQLDPSAQTNPNYSLFNDTAVYFLTWNTSIFNRRMDPITDTVFSGYTAAPYFFKEERQDYTSSYYGGFYSASNIYNPEYTKGEGWFDAAFGVNSSNPCCKTKNIATPNIFTSGPSAIINTVVVGANNNSHQLEIRINNALVKDTTYNSFNIARFNFSVPATSLSSPTTEFKFSSTGSQVDRQAISYISVKYPHTFNLGNSTTFQLIIPDDISQSKSFLNISNFNTLSSTARLYDLKNIPLRRITVVPNGSNLNALVPNSGSEKECYLTSDNAISYITSLKSVSSTGYFTDYTAVDPDSAFVIITHRSLLPESRNYAKYRNSFDGGSHDTLVADIDELYDQFAYGIKKHPMAIRGFADFILSPLTWTTPPQHLFLIGKAIVADKSRNGINYSDNLVPTFGHPPSDNLLTAGLNLTLYEPAIPTGRLAAKTLKNIEDYLDKVKEYEENQADISPSSQTLINKEWMKQVAHFAGGGNLSEQNTLLGFLNQYKEIIEDTLFGGNVHTFKKNSSDPIQYSMENSIKELINNGVSLMTFFAHAAGSGFDISIDHPDVYTNYGKYPLLIANSCLIGDIHQPGSGSTSEEWVLYPNKGVIGFLASVSLGEQGPLHIYTKELYKNLGQTFYGETIGKIIRKTIEETQPGIKKTDLEMTLHGDPAIIINAHNEPDYVITESNVYYTPEIVTTETDSFDVNIIITNIGRAINNSFSVELIRSFSVVGVPDTTYNRTVTAPYYKDTVTFTLPVDLFNGPGLNTFQINIDLKPNVIPELEDFENNSINVPLLIISGDIIPVFPYRYAIIPNDNVTLKASTGDPFAAARDYIFEIDTTDLFNSPFKKYQKINQSGGVVNAPMTGWQPSSFTFEDSTVYFWRVRWDSTTPTDLNHLWRESSFQYIDGKTGWGQSHFFQFKNDQFNSIGYNRTSRRFDFDTIPKILHCRNIGSTGPQQSSIEYTIDAILQGSSSCSFLPAMLIAVIDSFTFIPWKSNVYDYGHTNYLNCLGWYSPQNYFTFHSQDSAQRANIANMLVSIPDGNYILAYTVNGGYFQQWEASVLQVFQNLGSTQISTIGNNIPYIFFVKKGDISTVEEVYGSTVTDTIDLYANLQNLWPMGDITSTVVGPATNWGSLHWQVSELESYDIARLKVTGIDLSGNEAVISTLDSLPPGPFDIYNLNSLVDAAAYPYLKLNIFKRDDTLKTPAQLTRWQVIYEGVPEAALNPSIYYYFHNDTLMEGDIMQFSTVVENISEYDMDSLSVSFKIYDENRNVNPVSYKFHKPLLASDTLLISAEYSTDGLPGLNSLWIEINPMDSLWQLEQYHFNNIAQKFFYVKGDRTNPILDITFDGVHILNGDIVSAKPYILIQLNDENKYLALDTASLLQVNIKYPGENFDVPVPYDGKILRFIPATLPKNKAKLEYTPEFTEDGIYELRVRGRDKSNNESGDIDYSISFEVINKPTITQVLNWPNPFSTSTRFVFTLTGSEVPEKFKIQIITITGKVVKEIFADELGPIHIGPNITEYAWDGKDQFGDQLANGIYLYKVVVLLNGSSIERRETAADKYFHKGFGKMYLMR